MPRHGLAQSISFEHRCEIVHPSVDARQTRFLSLIAKLREVVRGSSHGARKMGGDRIGMEEVGDSDAKCSRSAPMGGGVFRMPGSHDQWRPVRIRGGERIAISVGIVDRRVGTPERVMILGIEARDESALAARVLS